VSAVAVRGNWQGRGRNAFSNNWWAGRPGWNGAHWRHHHHWNRYPARHWWGAATAVAVTGWFTGWWDQPAYYNYGDTVYYQDDSVYYGDQVAASAEQYYEQAVGLAETVPEIDDENAEWMPLGVFALTQPDSEASNMVVQLAVSKEGVIAGTFFNDTTEATHPVEGMVDRKTQRAAWHFVDDTNPGLVMETGIFNLTKDETTALVHFGSDQTQEWLMVRLEEPESDAPN